MTIYLEQKKCSTPFLVFLGAFKYCCGSQETTRTSAASLPFKGCRTSEKEKAFDDNNVGRVTVGPNVKNPPKNRFQKIVKLTDHTYACNSLTNFTLKCKTHASKFAEICMEELVHHVKLHHVNLFCGGF